MDNSAANLPSDLRVVLNCLKQLGPASIPLIVKVLLAEDAQKPQSQRRWRVWGYAEVMGYVADLNEQGLVKRLGVYRYPQYGKCRFVRELFAAADDKRQPENWRKILPRRHEGNKINHEFSQNDTKMKRQNNSVNSCLFAAKQQLLFI